jgi:phosphopantothenoylcysteine decarboxylase / phosphopantothenate---cysteine ligase
MVYTGARFRVVKRYVTDTQRKKILLGVTGGVAAYKSAELVRRLTERGLEVHVVMTHAACGFITPATMQALSGNPVFTDMWDTRIANSMAHIELSRDKSLIVVAPATADFMAKLSVGMADDLLSTLCVARDCPLMVVPAMNRQMWQHAATQRNVTQLRADGIDILGPAAGDQACGEVGVGRMVEPVEIAEAIAARLASQVLAGVHMLITAGPTFEAIDAVRGLTNRSSGKMGYAVARAAVESGANVTLVSGPTSLAAPAGVKRIDVVSARDMFEAVKTRIAATDVFVSVAAVADYRPAAPKEHKIKKSDRALSLELVPNEDILAYVSGLPKPPFCVGFAAESERLSEYAEEKRKRKKIPLLAANLAQHAIGADENEITLLDDEGSHPLARAPKDVVARQLVAHIAKLYKRTVKNGQH